MTRLRRTSLAALVVCIAGWIGVGAADAATATYTVTTTVNNGPTGGDCATTDTDCSLRQAFYTADGMGTVVIILPAGTYDTGGLVSQNATVTLNGAGAASTIIDGSGSSSSADLRVNSGSLSASGVTIQDAPASGVVVAGPASATFTNVVIRDNSTSEYAGGIEAYGSLTLDHDQILDNTALGSSVGGGGLNVNGTANKTNRITITNTSVVGNQATYGGGIEEFANATNNVTSVVTISSSLIAANSATQSGGGFEGPGTASGNVEGFTMSDTTVVNNSAGAYGGGLSLGGQSQRLYDDTIANNNAQNGGDVATGTNPGATIEDTIIAGGAASVSGDDCLDASTYPLVSLGHNLDDLNGCSFKPNLGDLVSTDPKLAALADNGGPTQTMAPALTSPAIDQGGSSCQATDQRGVAAPQGAACDIGAYESAQPSIAETESSGVSANAATVDASVANPDAANATVTVHWGTSAGSYPNSAESQTAVPLTGASPYAFGLSGLVPSTTYHYQVTVTGARGSASSPDGFFTTPAAQVTTTTAGSTTTPTAPATSTTSTTASTTTTSQTTLTSASNRFTIAKLRVSRAGRLTASLGAPGAGIFTAKATFSVTTKVTVRKHGKKVLERRTTYIYGSATVRSTKKDTQALAIGLSRAAKAELAKLNEAKVTLAVTFTPRGGKAATKWPTLTVHRSRKGIYT